MLMKKYKANYMFTIFFNIINTVLSIIPGMAISFLIIDPYELWNVIFAIIAAVSFFVVLGIILNLIVSLFCKYTVFIDEDTITVKGKKIVTQSINLSEVTYVVFDKGYNSVPCSVTLHDVSGKKSLSINHPSFLLMCYLQIKLSDVKFRFNNYKFYIGFVFLGVIIGIGVAVFGSCGA